MIRKRTKYNFQKYKKWISCIADRNSEVEDRCDIITQNSIQKAEDKKKD